MAPASSIATTAAWWPNCAAYCIGVKPERVRASTVAAACTGGEMGRREEMGRRWEEMGKRWGRDGR